MNKKIFFVAGAVAAVFLFAGVATVHADNPGFIRPRVNPNPAISTIVITTNVIGGSQLEAGDGDCPSGARQADWQEEFELTTLTWSISSTGLKGSLPFVVTRAGRNGDGCNLAGLSWDYSASSSPIDITSLTSGVIYNAVLDAVNNDGDEATTIIPFCVGSCGGTSATGTISVISQNASTNDPVPASWDFTGTDANGNPIIDPCSSGCSNTSGLTFFDLELGTYELNPGIQPSGYVLQSVNRHEDVAKIQNPVMAFFAGLFNKADAYVVCGFTDGGSTSCPNGTANPLTLATSSGVSSPTASFTIEWAPVGTIDVTPPPTLTTAQPSAQMGLADTNGTEGSSVNNLSVQSVNYGSGEPTGWLSIPSLAGITLNQGAGVTNVTVTATSFPSGCSSGCTATVELQGNSPGDPTPIYSSPFDVTLNTSASGYTVSIAPHSASVQTSATQQFTPTTNDSAGVNWTLSGSGCGGSTCGTLSSASSLNGVAITYTAPATVPSPATVTIKATNATDGTASDSGIIIVTVPAGKPTVSLTVNPQVINLKNSATLTWNTTGANTCTASAAPKEGDWNGSEPTANSGPMSAVVTPTAAGLETYKLTCKNGVGSTATTTQLQVINCTIGANPTSVIVPGQTTVTAACQSVPVNYTCTLTGTGIDGSVQTDPDPALSNRPNLSVNWTTTPAVNTQYTISCTDPTSFESASATVPVSVTNPGTGECPPQGCTP